MEVLQEAAAPLVATKAGAGPRRRYLMFLSGAAASAEGKMDRTGFLELSPEPLGCMSILPTLVSQNIL